MLYTLKDLLDIVSHTQTEINGKWVPARPMSGPFIWKVKAAWLVLTGKADIIIWPEGQ